MIAAAHALALTAAWTNALPMVYKLFLATGIAGHLYVAFKRLEKAQPAIKYAEASGWEITDGDKFESVEILNSTVLTIHAIWLHVKKQNNLGFFSNSKKTILIVSDALDEDDFSRLIVRLKTSVKQ